MRILRNLIAFILFIALVGGVIFILYNAIRYLVIQWEFISVDQKAGMIVLTFTLLICTLVIASAIRRGTKKSGPIFPAKAKAYTDYIVWYVKLSEKNTTEGFYSRLSKIRTSLLLWGSNEVVKQVLLLYEEVGNANHDEQLLMKTANNLYLEIRRDLGYREL